MDRNSLFFKQVELLVRVLPIVAQQTCFALKGGTALNLFIRDLPRLSVDIDLAYLPIEDRVSSLAAIDQALKAIALSIESRLGAQVKSVVVKDTDKWIKLNVTQGSSSIKIEVSPVLRGSVFDAETRTVTSRVEDTFGFAEMKVLSFEDLYAGKICAALDRQHPRDFYDVKLLLENEGFSEQTRRAFLVYVIGHNRPMAELLSPNLSDLQASFQADFEGMTFDPVTIKELVHVRRALIELINESLTEEDKNFLLSVKLGEPDWEHLALPHVETLPAVRWKLHNLSKMNKDRHRQAIEKLRHILFE